MSLDGLVLFSGGSALLHCYRVNVSSCCFDVVSTFNVGRQGISEVAVRSDQKIAVSVGWDHR